MGSFASKHVPDMDVDELTADEVILGMETVDLFNVITGKMEPPSDVNLDMLQRLKDHAQSSPLGHASPEGYAQVKTVMSN